MSTLPPCCEEEENVSEDVCLFLPLLLFCPPSPGLSFRNCVPHCFICHFLFIPPPRTLSPSTAPLSPSQALSLPLRLSPCHFHFSPTAPGCWLPLKSWLLWLRLAVCDKGLQARLALMNTQPHHLNGLPPEDWAGSWLAVLGANESRLTAGPGGCDNRGCRVFYRF